jgi:hypothetical protein
MQIEIGQNLALLLGTVIIVLGSVCVALIDAWKKKK